MSKGFSTGWTAEADVCGSVNPALALALALLSAQIREAIVSACVLLVRYHVVEPQISLIALSQ